METLRCLRSIALTEWKLQVRSVIFWASLIVLLLYTLGETVGAPAKILFLPRAWLGSRDDSLTWLSIGLIFLVPSALIRDRRTGAFVWVTPVTGYTYAAGKLLGLWLTAFTLVGIELAAQGVARAKGWEQLTPEIVGMMLTSTGRWAIGIVYITGIFFLITVIAKGKPLFAYACCSAYFIAVLSMNDIANPLCIFPFPVFRSDLVWNGPESALFEANRNLYLSLAVPTSMLAVLIYPWRERRSIYSKAMQVLLAIGVMVSLSTTVWAVRDFVQARSKVLTPIKPRLDASSILAGEDVQSIRVEMRAMLAQGLVQGNVELSLSGTVSDLYFYVPAGLEVTSVTDCQGQVLSSRLGDEWMRIVTPSSRVCVAFEGTWRVDRSRYQRRGHINPDDLILNAGAYTQHGYLYLVPGYRWYPAPVGPYEWQAKHDIEIVLPSATSVFVSPRTYTESGEGWVTYRWQNERGKPLITLASGEYREVPLPGSDVVWAAPEHEHVAPQAAGFYLEFLKPIQKLIRRDDAPLIIVETPLLRWPVASTDLVLLPEDYFAERLSPALSKRYETHASVWGPDFALRYEAYYTARGWLQGQAYFADPVFVRVTPFFDVVDTYQVDPSFYVPLRECIAHYLAVQLVDQRLGINLLEKMVNERLRYADQYLDNPTGQGGGVALSSVIPFDSYETTWSFNQMFAAFGRLERHVGREQVNLMINQLLMSRAGSTITIEDWLEVVEKVAGREARQEFEEGYQWQGGTK